MKKPKTILFNPRSTKHMGCLFWDILELKKFIDPRQVKDFLTDRGEKARDKENNREEWKNPMNIPAEFLSTGQKVIDLLNAKDAHPVVSKLAEYRGMYKLFSSYLEPMQVTWVSSDGLVHSTNKIHGTVGGRLASEKPNMQNIPRGSVIKNLFISILG